MGRCYFLKSPVLIDSQVFRSMYKHTPPRKTHNTTNDRTAQLDIQLLNQELFAAGLALNNT